MVFIVLVGTQRNEMTIFAIKSKKLDEIHEAPFKLEREIQELFEANLLIDKMLINECDERVDVSPIDIL